MELGGRNGDVEAGGQEAVIVFANPSVDGHYILLPVKEGGMLVLVNLPMIGGINTVPSAILDCPGQWYGAIARMSVVSLVKILQILDTVSVESSIKSLRPSIMKASIGDSDPEYWASSVEWI